MLGSELKSWKEIAEYLGVTVRTAQNYELVRGLPIIRVPGKRGLVRANVSELELWKAGKKASSTPESAFHIATNETKPDTALRVRDQIQPGQPAIERAFYHRAIFALPRFLKTQIAVRILVLSALLIAAATVYFVVTRHGPPAHWRMEDTTLIITDQEGKELWRYLSKRPIYSAFYQAPPAIENPPVWIGELNSGGGVKVIVSEKMDGKESDSLVCFSDSGTEEWRFTPGRQVKAPSDNFAPFIFMIRRFVVTPMGEGRQNAILVIAYHFPFYPTQIALLAANGKIEHEYWHSGHIAIGMNTMRIEDLNKDGIDEIYLGGTSNGNRLATLVILDPDDFTGASIESNPKYQLGNFDPGREIARVFFPRACIQNYPYNNVENLIVTGTSLAVSVSEPFSPVNYFCNLTQHLEVAGLSFGDGYRKAYEERLATGKLPKECTGTDQEGRLKNIQILWGSSSKTRSFREMNQHAAMRDANISK
jgi:hypothetical protein